MYILVDNYYIKYILIQCVAIAALLITSCKSETNSLNTVIKNKTMISKAIFGSNDATGSVDLYTLSNGVMEVDIINFGATITSIRIPDKNGMLGDVVLGFDDIQSYIAPHPYFGVTVGRYGNRIANAQFSLDGISYSLKANNGPNSLHGGVSGFDKKMWKAELEGPNTLKLEYLSPDGEEGFPGNLNVIVKFSLDENNALRIDYEAATDQKTICNLTNHSYFNLDGHSSGDILGHQLLINANQYTPVDSNMIPTGELKDVTKSPFDFRVLTRIGARIESEHPQLKLGGGYDHNYVVRDGLNGALNEVAQVYSEISGRRMMVFSTEPGVQLYTGNFIDSIKGKSESVYTKRQGFCLETQHFPNSPNQSTFPSTTLDVGQRYTSTTVYQFDVKQ